MNTGLNLKDNVIIVTSGASNWAGHLSMNYYHKVLMSRWLIFGGDRHHNGDNYHFWPTDISSATEVQQTIDAIIQR